MSFIYFHKRIHAIYYYDTGDVTIIKNSFIMQFPLWTNNTKTVKVMPYNSITVNFLREIKEH